jgi:hypothetical protein
MLDALSRSSLFIAVPKLNTENAPEGIVMKMVYKLMVKEPVLAKVDLFCMPDG